MEMGWLQTVELIGLDLQAGAILALLGLHVLEHALQTAWIAFSEWRTARRVPAQAAPCITLGQVHRT